MPFPIDQYIAMADLLHTIKGGAILSINDHPEIREIFADFAMTEVELSYTVGGATNRTSSRELIIKSW